jgi:hypothetical protein
VELAAPRPEGPGGDAVDVFRLAYVADAIGA